VLPPGNITVVSFADGKRKRCVSWVRRSVSALGEHGQGMNLIAAYASPPPIVALDLRVGDDMAIMAGPKVLRPHGITFDVLEFSLTDAADCLQHGLPQNGS
jgi:hypothetical protein